MANSSNTFVSLYPTYRKLFDRIFHGRKQRAGPPAVVAPVRLPQGDDFRTFLADFVSNLPHTSSLMLDL